jgi:hypothetical protein
MLVNAVAGLESGFGRNADFWRSIRCVFLDLDGVVFQGSMVLPGTVRFGAFLRANGIRLIVVSNNSHHSQKMVARRLSRAGLAVVPEDIVTASLAVEAYLHRTFAAGTRVMVLGTPALRRILQRSGKFVAVDRAAQVVVVGRQRHWCSKCGSKRAAPWRLARRSSAPIRTTRFLRKTACCRKPARCFPTSRRQPAGDRLCLETPAG